MMWQHSVANHYQVLQMC